MTSLKTLSVALLFFSQTLLASPWMTGPLLAPNGKTIPKGHVNFEPYSFYTTYPRNFRNFEEVPVLSFGLTDFLDLKMAIPYDFDWFKDQHTSNFGDSSLGFGIQLIRQKELSWFPDIRLTAQEVFPTGKFDQLDSKKLGTDQTGAGSYQTVLGLAFQHLMELKNEHYLRTRLNLAGGMGTNVKLKGLNAYGGDITTAGIVSLGNSYSADLAFEYSLTQHWVPVFEMIFVDSESTNFSGNPGFTPAGTINTVGGAGGTQLSLAPAIEYNVNANLGIIGGVWFPVTGPPSGQFTTYALAINYYF